MKTNKEFIEEIYRKADEISIEKKIEKKNKTARILNIAAILIIVFAIGINLNQVQENQSINSQKENAQEENIISLKTVNTFENFCSIIKKSNEKMSVNYLESIEALTYSSEDTTTSEKNQSNTNNQVENVDEADIVKIDQDYIYYISGKKVVIINAKNGKESEKIAEIDYSEEEYHPQEIYAKNNNLIVIAQKYGIYSTVCGTYDTAYPLDQSKTFIIIYDILNKEEPKELRKIEIEGDYISSRMIQDNIYFATTKNIYDSDIVNEETEMLDEEKYKPKYKDTAISQEEKSIGYDSIYCFEDIESTNYLIVGGINLKNNEEVDMQTFLGAGNYIYSSEKNMYIATTKHQYNENNEHIGGSTHIRKFSLVNGKIKFQAEANIEGQINNQFSMDESGEYFRIATTIGDYWNMSENTSNSLYILNDKLELVGKVTDFAKEERIYSVRYVDNKAYVVTFKQTDPLFVIDLSDPTNPQILGELKIPGYSTYLHPYDETHIIGFGYDTKEDGTRITTNDLKMVMFDVSDVNNPKELFKVTVGDRNTTSELEYNHKALLFSKEKNIIAFPLTTYEKNNTNTRAVIYQIDLTQGFILKGEISNKYKDNSQRVERIIFVNDTYYTLSKSCVKAVNIETLQVIKEIEI